MTPRLLAALALLASLLAVPSPAAASEVERISKRRPTVEMPLPWTPRAKHLPYPLRRR